MEPNEILNQHHSTVRKFIAECGDQKLLEDMLEEEQTGAAREWCVEALTERLLEIESASENTNDAEASSESGAPAVDTEDETLSDAEVLEAVAVAAPDHPVSLVRLDEAEGYEAVAAPGIEVVSVKHHPVQEWVKVVYVADGGYRSAYFDAQTCRQLQNI